ncbi:MAG: helix-turn-helix domain-containing protein [Blastomonas fulva]|uniref:helix-turn-helix domain-containing protein n=1 Tax=Blastomonas fulva TaxID=1550728 RepID=UPI0040349B1F
MIKSDMPVRYEEFPPDPPLAPFVEAFWQFSLDPSDPDRIVHTIVPDGSVSLAASFWSGRLVGVELVGAAEIAQTVQLVQGMTVVGARLRPGASLTLIGIAPLQIAGTMQSLPQSHWAFAAFERGLEGLTAALEARIGDLSPPDAVIAAAAQAMDAGRPVAAVAAALGLSPRQLQRRFLAATGLAPKAWQRVRRQRFAWINHVTGDATNLTQAAYSAGFADSAHFSRETRRSFHLSAGEVAAYLATIDHGPLQTPSDR